MDDQQEWEDENPKEAAAEGGKNGDEGRRLEVEAGGPGEDEIL